MITLRYLLILAMAVLPFGCSEPVVPEPPKERIMLIARDPVTRVSTLYRLNSDGTELSAITAVNAPSTPRIGVTMGGRYLFYTGKSGSELPLYVFDTEMRTQRALSDGTAAFPTVSQDGRRIAWFEIRGSGTSLVVANADGMGRTVLVDSNNSMAAIRVAGAPAWSPDGTSVLFCGVSPGTVPEAQERPFVVDVTTKGITPIPTTERVQHANWVNASMVVFATTSGGTQVLRFLNVQSGTEAMDPIPVPALASPFISVSPDRSTLVCSNPLTLVNLTSRVVTPLGVSEAITHDVMWSKDGSEFVYGVKTSTQLYSEKLFRVSNSGTLRPMAGVDSLGSSASVSYVRMP